MLPHVSLSSVSGSEDKTGDVDKFTFCPTLSTLPGRKGLGTGRFCFTNKEIGLDNEEKNHLLVVSNMSADATAEDCNAVCAKHPQANFASFVQKNDGTKECRCDIECNGPNLEHPYKVQRNVKVSIYARSKCDYQLSTWSKCNAGAMCLSPDISKDSMSDKVDEFDGYHCQKFCETYDYAQFKRKDDRTICQCFTSCDSPVAPRRGWDVTIYKTNDAVCPSLS